MIFGCDGPSVLRFDRLILIIALLIQSNDLRPIDDFIADIVLPSGSLQSTDDNLNMFNYGDQRSRGKSIHSSICQIEFANGAHNYRFQLLRVFDENVRFYVHDGTLNRMDIWHSSLLFDTILPAILSPSRQCFRRCNEIDGKVSHCEYSNG